MSLWQAEVETEAWAVESTLGAMVGNKHAFFGAMFLENANQILAYTYGGAMHQWMRKATSSEDEPSVWQPSLTVMGHFSDVSDLAWDEHELSLVSASTD